MAELMAALPHVLACDVAVGRARGQAIDAGDPGRDLGRPFRRIGLGMGLLQRLPLALERHERHTPAATGLDALNRNIEDLPGAGHQGEMGGELLPFRVLRLMIQRMEVGDRQQVGRTEGLADIALALDLAHAQRVAANVVRALRQAQGCSV